MAENIDSAETELAKLRAQIDSITARLDAADSTRDVTSRRSKRCYFLEKVPLELRQEIYKLLLIDVNGVLAMPHEFEPLDAGEPELVVTEYGLFPAILSTCRQISQEGAEILYGMNTFFFDCRKYKFNSPIMGEWAPPGFFRYLGIDELPRTRTLKKVRNWKIVVSATQDANFAAPDPRFVLLCREICSSPLQSLEVVIHLPSLASARSRPYPVFAPVLESKVFIEDLLKPLSMFRNVGRFRLDTGAGENLLPIAEGSKDLRMAFGLSEGLGSCLEFLITGDSPVILVFRMYDVLLRYASMFERYEEFRLAMATDYLQTRLGNRSPPPYHHRSNPFQERPIHPVEDGLRKANILSNGDNLEEFLAIRDNVLEYLEPQYQRIAAAATATADYVKSVKKRGCLFEPAGIHPYCNVTREDLAEAVLVLEDYAVTFARDMPEVTRRKVRLMNLDFDLYYSTQPRAFLLNQASALLNAMRKEEGQIPRKSLAHFVKVFKATVDDMDSQYLQIRSARRALFDHDGSHDPRTIDLELGRWDEWINWDVCEPNTDVRRDNGFEEWYSDQIGGGLAHD
jgi:hypothetical protein